MGGFRDGPTIRAPGASSAARRSRSPSSVWDAARSGGFRGALTEDEADAILRTAHDAGIGLFDTAPLYGFGQSELRLGHLLRQLPRESFVLSTKVGRWLEPLRPGAPRTGWRAGGLEFLPTYDLSRDGVLRALEQSHCRLGLATHRHRPDPRRRSGHPRRARWLRAALSRGAGGRLSRRSTSCAGRA